MLKDLYHGLHVQTGKEMLMMSRNIVINSEHEANADLLCGSSQLLCVG